METSSRYGIIPVKKPGFTSRNLLRVPYKDGIITFGLPLNRPDSYQKIMDKISQDGMLRPTTAQTFSLIDLALKTPDEKGPCWEILFQLQYYGLWTSTENLYIPNKIIVYDDIDGKMPSDSKSLLKRFKDGDKAVRAISYEFKRHAQSVSDLVKNPYIIAQVGDKDFAEDVVARVAEKLSKEISPVYKSKKFETYVLALDENQINTKIDKTIYTSLDSHFDNHWLDVIGSCGHAHDDNIRKCCAAGMLESAKSKD